jgi:hypothetical protein
MYDVSSPDENTGVAIHCSWLEDSEVVLGLIVTMQA